MKHTAQSLLASLLLGSYAHTADIEPAPQINITRSADHDTKVYSTETPHRAGDSTIRHIPKDDSNSDTQASTLGEAPWYLEPYIFVHPNGRAAPRVLLSVDPLLLDEQNANETQDLQDEFKSETHTQLYK